MTVCEVLSESGILAAGYQPAAKLSKCLIRRGDGQLNEQCSEFSAQILDFDSYWISKSTSVILFMAKAYWWWDVKITILGIDKIEGVARGNPIITTYLPPPLREWKNE